MSTSTNSAKTSRSSSSSSRPLYAFAYGEQAIKSSAVTARHAGFAAFVSTVFGTGRPLIGSLTIVFDGYVCQFGVPREKDAEFLTAIHSNNAPPEPTDDVLDPREACGFDFDDANLGLALDDSRRYQRPVLRDDAPGRWVHPVVKVHTARFFTRLLTQRNLGVGEAFLAGEFEMLRGAVNHFLGFLLINDIDRSVKLPLTEQARLLRMYAAGRMRRSHNEDIAHHYDMGDNVMVPMLGATGCYSCGYMENENDSLDQMQVNKMNLIFSKMQLRPNARILDTGCGNGGMLVHAATAWGARGEGFTNSHNMASLARRNAERNGVGDKIKIHHADFSLLASFPENHFDAIYEVGVWEHLPFHTYEEVMRQCWRILKPSGRMLIHSMGSHTAKHRRDGYIQKYIFRDSNQIRLHLLLNEACKLNMYVGDVENLGRHYYWTLWHWRENLLKAAEQDPSIRDRDLKVMIYFLECGMAESRFGNGSVYHILLFKDARNYRNTWRVDGRVHEEGRGNMQNRPLVMQPSSSNDHLFNDPHAKAKDDAAVYQKPTLPKRIAHLADILLRVGHH